MLIDFMTQVKQLIIHVHGNVNKIIRMCLIDEVRSVCNASNELMIRLVRHVIIRDCVSYELDGIELRILTV